MNISLGENNSENNTYTNLILFIIFTLLSDIWDIWEMS